MADAVRARRRPSLGRLLQGRGQRPPLASDDCPGNGRMQLGTGRCATAPPADVSMQFLDIASRAPTAELAGGIADTAGEGLARFWVGEVEIGQVAPGGICWFRRPGAAVAGGNDLHEIAGRQRRAVSGHDRLRARGLCNCGRPAAPRKNQLSHCHAQLRSASASFVAERKRRRKRV